MFINSHIATGYLAGKISNEKTKFLALWCLATVVPDIDGLWSSTVIEHHSILHTPIFWIFFCTPIYILGVYYKNPQIKKTSFILFLGSFIHLFTDWLTARTVGIKWLYPFNDIDYFLYEIQPAKGNIPIIEMLISPYINFYFENKLLAYFEVGLSIMALGLFLRSFLIKKYS